MTQAPDTIGLCRHCIHARVVRTPRSTFWRCALAEADARFVRYPRLPVLECDGYERSPDEADPKSNGPDEEPPGPPSKA